LKIVTSQTQIRMKPIIFIDGDQGTTGLQIAARVQARDDLSLLSLPRERRKDALWRAKAINECDFAILCLPDGAARDAVASVTNPKVRVIDASSAHRTDPRWIYGFPEMAASQGSLIASASRVSNPGCYPTGAIALIRPLVAAGLLPADHPVTVNAVSGYSGRGRQGIQENEEGSQGELAALQVYGLGLEHKHVPEIELHSGLTQRPLFVPAYGAFRQGIVLTIGLHTRLLPQKVDGSRLHDCLNSYFAAHPKVQVLAQAQSRALEYLNPQELNGSDQLRLGVIANERCGQVLLWAVFDNLGKGAAGAAMQNLDLMLSRH
jgi:N-acetyl-gamma-glutamyl-phosphate reductase